MLQRSTLLPPPPLAELKRAALFLDFDGTLVEIAEGPDAIEPPGDLAARLEALRECLSGRLAVVTGRGLDNLEQILGPCAVWKAGSHGAHVLAPDREVLRQAKALPDEAIAALSLFAKDNNLLYERKLHGGALHYRSKSELEDKVGAIADKVAGEHGLAVKRGKCVVELVWPGADKGGAVRTICTQADFAGSHPVFIGDDVTDEDGMAAASELGGFGIAVGEHAFVNATHHLKTVKDVYEWLKL